MTACQAAGVSVTGERGSGGGPAWRDFVCWTSGYWMVGAEFSGVFFL
jgi:hypothetical protein